MTTARRAGSAPGAASKAEIAREAVSAAIDELAAQLDAGKSESLTAYLDMMGRFHRYSFGNIMLIMGQRPDATRVAGLRAWQSMGRCVKRGEKGIVIIAPMVFTKSDHDERSDSDRPVVRFRATHVFDISQTEGEPLPELDRIGGDPGKHLHMLEAAIAADGIRLETVND
ncbi:MAG: ArdC family protein, partial [Planctomycetota bacterium]